MRSDFSPETVTGAPWAFIAVMGVTGAGKSTFIQWASGSSEIQIGHDLESCTSDITGYTFFFNGYNINLVDTPGFNDTHKSETEVLQDIASWLKETYEGDTRLNGIIYLHSLGNVRMEGSALRNLKMFRQLCGKEPLKNVILATTFWSEVAKDDAIRREEQLRATPEFWGDMLDRGSTMKRLVDHASALEIVGLLVKKPQITLQIQQELVEDNKSLVDTAAGQAVNEELMRIQQKHEHDLKRVQKELHEALEEKDHEMQHILEQQQQRLDKEMDKVRRQQEQLRYDRRAERRKIESEFGHQLHGIREEYERRARAEREAHQAMLQQLNFDQAVALVRANEGKIPVQEREELERKIAELSKELNKLSANTTKPGKSGVRPERKKSGSSRYLFRALEVALPITTMALLGVPIFSPFGGGGGGLIDKIFGGGEAQDGAQEPAA
ncbi:Nn.00g075990.m01.CDS01 [Neocucurbitaria sp. VM-36]